MTDPTPVDAPKVGETWRFDAAGATPCVIYAVRGDVAYYYDPSDPEDVSSSTFDAMARLARRVSRRVVMADEVEALRAERDAAVRAVAESDLTKAHARGVLRGPAESGDADAIVRDLAASDPVSGRMCELCQATTSSGKSEVRPEDHDERCPWLHARSYVGEGS